MGEEVAGFQKGAQQRARFGVAGVVHDPHRDPADEIGEPGLAPRGFGLVFVQRQAGIEQGADDRLKQRRRALVQRRDIRQAAMRPVIEQPGQQAGPETRIVGHREIGRR